MAKLHYRFSLRSIVVFMLLATAATGLWLRWDPWVLDRDADPDDSKGWRLLVSPDRSKVVAPSGNDDSLVIIYENGGHARVLAKLRGHKGQVYGAAFSPDGSRVMTASASFSPGGELLADPAVKIWKRRRPERWWGVFWLWEFWLTVVFAALLIWSLCRDRKYFKSLAAKHPQPSPPEPGPSLPSDGSA